MIKESAAMNDTTKETKIDELEYIDFEEGFLQVKSEVEKALSASPPIIRKYTKHLSKSQGKFIRTRALLLCAEDEEKGIHPDAIKLAAAIEILHLATLVHDDIIDNADLRRGIVTLQKEYGKRTAVICGDYLLCLALKLTYSVTEREKYLKFNMPDYMGRVCIGELNQHINNGNLNLSVYDYLKIISGKTAALFEAAFYAGAVVNKKEKNFVNEYKKLGQYIGMIFQLADDCIDFEKTVEKAKKPVQSDYEQGVITLPLIHALRTKKEFKEKALRQEITREEINDAVENTGGIVFTKSLSKKYYNKALKIITGLDISKRKREKFLTILDKASGSL